MGRGRPERPVIPGTAQTARGIRRPRQKHQGERGDGPTGGWKAWKQASNGWKQANNNWKQTKAQLLNTVNGMRGELGNLSGSFFQRRAANFADRVARRDFRLRQTSLIHHADQVGDSRLKPILDEAVDDASNTFTENDAASVEQADAVIAGKAPDGSDTYLVVETSITVVKDDVDRARDRAELLERAHRRRNPTPWS